MLSLPYHIFFDNFFTTVPLLEELLRHNIRGTGTVRENRMSKCTVQSKTDMKKTTRGTYDYGSTENKVLIVKWNDNNISLWLNGFKKSQRSANASSPIKTNGNASLLFIVLVGGGMESFRCSNTGFMMPDSKGIFDKRDFKAPGGRNWK
ncbi:unnamed protein product [Acanthoscelides obtectus]|uniref:PiggyBac transposable element-derived protein domain-containing protein n=1 Tax=Acanthoscelides obtectus TaxID=200917 RepID=A0A9P0LVF1_ACAOB|nr:unnamed protein product [Acanthoscelides obtectus]CAK1624289.1 PiggyBac transposable element-derived protein 2 [Acanthoscelides obtectus]